MSKIGNKVIEVGELLTQGFDVDTISKIADVPVDWIIEVDLEMRGLGQHGYEDDYAAPNIG